MKIQRFLIALFWVDLLFVLVSAQTQPDIRSLSLGQPIERELKGDEAHSYSIAVTARQYLHVVVEQRGIDVVVMLFGADSKKLAEIDSPNGTQGPEPISMIVEVTGNYRLEVRSLEKTAPSGRYQIKIEELRTATEKDKNQIAARKAYDQGERLEREQTATSLREAITKYKEALSLYQALGDKHREVVTLNRIGVVYSGSGENQLALKFYKEALFLSRSIGDKSRSIGDKADEAFSLNGIGTVYSNLGEKQLALKFYKEALSTATGDKWTEAITLNNIADIHFDLGDNQKALKTFNDSLELFQTIRDQQGEALTLSSTGTVYSYLGEKLRALEFFNRSLPISRSLGDKLGEARTLNNMGFIYNELGNEQKALKYYDDSLVLFRTVGDKRGEAVALTNIGLVHDKLGDRQKALKFHNESLLLLRAVGNKRGEAQTLTSIGKVYDELGDKTKALKYYYDSLPLSRASGDKHGDAVTFNNLFNISVLGNPRFGVFFGKQAVKNYQILRSTAKGLDKDIQQTYLKTVEYTYRNLADALIKQQRFMEAQQVLNLFKDQQYFDFNSNLQTAPIVFTKRENELTIDFHRKLERIVAMIQQLDNYKRTIGDREPNKSESEQIQIYEANLKVDNDDYLTFLKQAEIEFSQPLSDKDKVGEIADTKEMQTALRSLQSQTGQKVVAIYTLATVENYRGLLITPDKIETVSYPIKAAELKQKAVKFFGQLSEFDKQTNAPKSSTSEVQKTGKELYDIVFAPVAAKLKELNFKPDVLMWSMDGALRYLPVAALFDGKQYLTEHYRNVVFTRSNSERMLAPVTSTWTGSGFYNSKAYSLAVRNPNDGMIKLTNFDGLKNAKTELETIFGVSLKQGVINGDLLFNEQFTRDSLFKALKLNRSLVHIASHFKFEAGDATASFLLLGDGTKLTLEDIKNTPDDLFKGVELLTLSACETGVQKERKLDRREIDSFAELAQRKGARAVLASLWKVDDESTSQLMMQFYQKRQVQKLTKVVALQKAQHSLLKDNRYSHPYYWSPFILMGNWR